MPDDTEWRERAACRGMNPSLFFPEKHDPCGVSAALAVCADCEVKAECLDSARYENDGIFGGTTPRQRRGMRRGYGKKRCRECGAGFAPVTRWQMCCSEACRVLSRRQYDRDRKRVSA